MPRSSFGELAARHIDPKSVEFAAILQWPFSPTPFYEAQVLRVLHDDVPQRCVWSTCLIWTYHEPDGTCVGFGTLELCDEYSQFTEGKYHWYIPVLGVHPSFRGRGHGRGIIQHLVQAAQAHLDDNISDLLFLDVYSGNASAIKLYRNHEFEVCNPETPILDQDQNNEPYVVMARKMSRGNDAANSEDSPT